MGVNFNVREDEYDGEVFSVSPLRHYKSGNGQFRTVVIRTRGMFNEMVYVPVTVFGADALDLAPATAGRPILVTARLRTFQYETAEGETKWMVGYSASKVELGQKPQPVREPEPEQVSMDSLPDDSDIPF